MSNRRALETFKILPITKNGFQTSSRTARDWGLGLAVATLFTAAQALQLTQRMPDVPWLELFLFELPVWYALFLVTPAIFWVARRLPLIGPRSFVNFLKHLVPAVVILCTQFFVVETLRRYIIMPLVLRTGIASTPGGVAYAQIAERLPLYEQALTSLRYFFLLFLVMYFAIAIFYYSVNYYRQLARTELRAQELQALLSKSQLDSLKLQLQPHFLFNTLNTVSSLMSRDIVLARRMLARLSDLLRESLRDFSVHEVPLGSELEFLDTYLEIQSARLGSRLKVQKKISVDTFDVLVPRMLLQPIVENATRHGMPDGDKPLTVQIEATLEANGLLLCVADDGNGLDGVELEEGVGLSNTRERLLQLYGAGFEMTAGERELGGFEVRIRIPARAESDSYRDMSDQREIA